MAKYSFEFKKKVVDAYNNKDGSFKYLCEKFNILAKTTNSLLANIILTKKIVHSFQSLEIIE